MATQMTTQVDFRALMKKVADAALACTTEQSSKCNSQEDKNSFYEGQESSTTTSRKRKIRSGNNDSRPTKRLRPSQNYSTKIEKLIDDAKLRIKEATEYYNL